MLNQRDREYYLRRVQAELDLGDAAPNAHVSAIHYELAAHYSLLTADRTAGSPHLTLVEGGLSSVCPPIEQDVARTAQECMG